MTFNLVAPVVDDDVRKVVCGADFCHNLLNDGLARAATTCTQYMKPTLNIIYRLLNKGTLLPANIDWIRDDSDRIILLLEKTFTNKGSLCNKYTPLMTLTKQHD
jgi:hypothetical protein